MPGLQSEIRSAIGVPASAPRSGYYSEHVLISENGAGTYDADINIPARALIGNLGIHAIALWTAGTSASLTVGDYTSSTGVAIDADGFIAATDLKATDALAGQSIQIMSGLASMGGVAGAYLAGTNTHWTDLYSIVARFLRFRVVSVGAGTAGRTLCFATWTFPVNMRLVTQ